MGSIKQKQKQFVMCGDIASQTQKNKRPNKGFHLYKR